MFKKVISLFMAFFITLNVSVFVQASTVAKVSSVNGIVNMEKSNSSKSFKVVKGMTVKVGDTITTGINGKIQITIGKNVVKAGKNTSFTLKELSGSGKNLKTDFLLHKGNIFNEVNEKVENTGSYKISTSNTVMGVRGTIFNVGSGISEDGQLKTELTTLEGSVEAKVINVDENGEISYDEVAVVEEGDTLSVITEEGEITETIEPTEYEKLSLDVLEFVKENEDLLTIQEMQKLDKAIEKVYNKEKQQIKRMEILQKKFEKEVEKQLEKDKRKEEKAKNKDDDDDDDDDYNNKPNRRPDAKKDKVSETVYMVDFYENNVKENIDLSKVFKDKDKDEMKYYIVSDDVKTTKKRFVQKIKVTTDSALIPTDSALTPREATIKTNEVVVVVEDLNSNTLYNDIGAYLFNNGYIDYLPENISDYIALDENYVGSFYKAEIIISGNNVSYNGGLNFGSYSVQVVAYDSSLYSVPVEAIFTVQYRKK